MKKLYLHMGMPKTGTSSLQYFLSENRDALASWGISFPDMGMHFNGIGDVRNGHFITLWNENASNVFQTGMKKLKDISSDFHSIFLSDEGLWRIQHQNGFWDHILPCMEEAGFVVCPIVYLRRQDLFVESYWNQGIKGRKKQVSTFSEYIDKKGYRYVPLHYDEELNKIASFVGEKNILVRLYDSNQLVENDIRRDLLTTIRVNPSGFDFSFGQNTNPSFSNEALEIKRLINTNQHYREIPNFYLTAWQESYETSHDAILPSFKSEERDMFLSEYRDGNAYVAQKYFGREDGKLFSENFTVWTPYFPTETIFEMEIVRMFSAGDVYLYQQMETLRKDYKELKHQIENIKITNKKMESHQKGFSFSRLKKRFQKII